MKGTAEAAQTTSTSTPRMDHPMASCKWKLAWALPLLYYFLASISTHITHNNHVDQHRNRQLLEHGIRGGDPPSDRTQNDSSSTPYIPISNVTLPLFAHSGTHHVHIYVGSPPQKQLLIVDTGSRAMAVPCRTKEMGNDCCGTHASDYFDPSKSSTYLVSDCDACLLKGISNCVKPLGFPGSAAKFNYCGFSQKYTEGSSWTATEVEDVVWLGYEDTSKSLQMMPKLGIAHPFGCQTSTSGLFRNQYADGILGLSIHETSLVTAVYKEGLIPSNSFSLCFTPKGGVLSLGGSLDPLKYHQEVMKMTPITHLDQHGYYSVEVVKLVVGENIVVADSNTKPRLLKDMNAGKGCILDSGTTDSYFPSSLARAVRKAVVAYGMEQAGMDSSGKLNLDEDSDLFSSKLRRRHYTFREFQSLLPTITVVLANAVELKLLPKHYMENVPLDENGNLQSWEGTRQLTNRLYFEEQKGFVLGQNAFMGYDILFDAGDDARIGIAPSDCHAASNDLATGR